MAMMPVAMAVPTHLLGLELRGFFAGGDGGMSVRIALRHAGVAEHLRRQRRGLCGSGERGGSRRDTECKFQKVPALHDMTSVLSSK
jgi:hypothetical protein